MFSSDWQAPPGVPVQNIWGAPLMQTIGIPSALAIGAGSPLPMPVAAAPTVDGARWVHQPLVLGDAPPQLSGPQPSAQHMAALSFGAYQQQVQQLQQLQQLQGLGLRVDLDLHAHAQSASPQQQQQQTTAQPSACCARGCGAELSASAPEFVMGCALLSAAGSSGGGSGCSCGQGPGGVGGGAGGGGGSVLGGAPLASSESDKVAASLQQLQLQLQPLQPPAVTAAIVRSELSPSAVEFRMAPSLPPALTLTKGASPLPSSSAGASGSGCCGAQYAGAGAQGSAGSGPLRSAMLPPGVFGGGVGGGVGGGGCYGTAVAGTSPGAGPGGLSPTAPEFVMGVSPPELKLSVAAPEFRPGVGLGGGGGIGGGTQTQGLLPLYARGGRGGGGGLATGEGALGLEQETDARAEAGEAGATAGHGSDGQEGQSDDLEPEEDEDEDEDGGFEALSGAEVPLELQLRLQMQLQAAVDSVPRLDYRALNFEPALHRRPTLPPSSALSASAASAVGSATLVATARAFALGGPLEAELLAERASLLRALDSSDARAAELEGVSVGDFHSLVPLDDRSRGHSARCYGVPTTVFKAVSASDGRNVALRRVEGSVQATAAELNAVLSLWLGVQHPSLVALEGGFLSDELSPGVPRAYFAHELCAAAVTVEAAFFVQIGAEPVTEAQLWSLAVQLVGLLYAVHSLGLATRGLEPARLLLTGGQHVRLNGVGVLELTRPDARPLIETQAEDLRSLGRLLLILSCRSPAAASEKCLARSLATMRTQYSAQLNCLASALLSPATSEPDCGLRQVCALISARLLEHSVALQAQNDAMRDALRLQAEHGHIARLLMKLAFVNERPELEGDPAWAETGDRYLLKLLRDALFHAVDADGAPVVSYAHAVSGLSKLNVGSDELLLLHGRDGRGTQLIVSYREMRGLLESAFADLVAAQQAARLDHEQSESEVGESLSLSDCS